MGSEARSFIPESEQSPKGPKRPDLKLVVDNTDRLSPEDARLEALLDEVALHSQI